jgi:hypothetical protein
MLIFSRACSTQEELANERKELRADSQAPFDSSGYATRAKPTEDDETGGGEVMLMDGKSDFFDMGGDVAYSIFLGGDLKQHYDESAVEGMDVEGVPESDSFFPAGDVHEAIPLLQKYKAKRKRKMEEGGSDTTTTRLRDVYELDLAKKGYQQFLESLARVEKNNTAVQAQFILEQVDKEMKSTTSSRIRREYFIKRCLYCLLDLDFANADNSRKVAYLLLAVEFGDASSGAASSFFDEVKGILSYVYQSRKDEPNALKDYVMMLVDQLKCRIGNMEKKFDKFVAIWSQELMYASTFSFILCWFSNLYHCIIYFAELILIL